jgi:hypothetical protein
MIKFSDFSLCTGGEVVRSKSWYGRSRKKLEEMNQDLNRVAK